MNRSLQSLITADKFRGPFGHIRPTYDLYTTIIITDTGQSQAPPTSEGEGGEGGDVSDEVDLRGFRPAGGPIMLQLLEMPPTSKSINNWTIRKGNDYPTSLGKGSLCL